MRIPQLDGRVEKVPAPALNLNHTGLRKALDSLAQLAGDPYETAGVETYADEQAEMPLLKPEPEPSAPLIAATPRVVIDGVASSTAGVQGFSRHQLEVEEPTPVDETEPVESSNGRVTSTRGNTAVDPVRMQHAAASLVPSMLALAQLADAPDSARTSQTKSSSRSGRATTLSPSAQQAALRSSTSPAAASSNKTSRTSMILTSVVSLLIGAGIGATAMQKLLQPDQSPLTLPASSPENGASATASEVSIGPVGLTGRVNYIDDDGQSRPDAGSRVLVLPAERQGKALLPAEAFRSGADPADLQVAEAAIAAMGGAFVTVDESGEYQAFLSSPTRFHVLILSQHMASALQGGHAAELLENYVDRPSALLGRVAWTVVTIRHQGSGSQSVDHTFVASQGQ